jgi:hypothetical protein
MRKAAIFFAFALSAFASATSVAQDPKKLFSVPFFIENITLVVPVALRADFTLQNPAILENFFMDCSSQPGGGLLFTDGGPLALHGTTGVPADPLVGLYVGSQPWLKFDFSPSTIGHYVYPPTQLGIPVKSVYTIIVFPTPGQNISCFGTVVFESLN